MRKVIMWAILVFGVTAIVMPSYSMAAGAHKHKHHHHHHHKKS